MLSIPVLGKASGKLVKHCPIGPNDLDLSLLNFLRGHGLPIASSCQGLGICEKCIINQCLLSCEISVKDYVAKYSEDTTVLVDYL